MGHNHGLGTLRRRSSPTPSLRLGAVLVLSLAACVAQLIGAWLTGSIALLTESVHMVVDLIGLSIAFAASVLPARFGEKRRERLGAIAALVQSTLLVGVGVYALIHGLQSILAPHPLAGEFLLFFAAAGLVANLGSVAILHGARKANLNLRAAFLEVLSDGLGSFLIILAGLIMVLTGFYQADGIAALALAALMVPRGVGLLRESLRALLPDSRRGWILGASLLLSLGLGLGVSQLHQLYSPAHYDLPLAPISGYSWTAEDEGLELSFGSDGQAVLTDGCTVARAPFTDLYGGVGFDRFEASGEDCSEQFPENLLSAYGAYYTEDFRTIDLVAADGASLARFSSEDRERDQAGQDFWTPLVGFLFRL